MASFEILGWLVETLISILFASCICIRAVLYLIHSFTYRTFPSFNTQKESIMVKIQYHINNFWHFNQYEFLIYQSIYNAFHVAFLHILLDWPEIITRTSTRVSICCIQRFSFVYSDHRLGRRKQDSDSSRPFCSLIELVISEDFCIKGTAFILC